MSKLPNASLEESTTLRVHLRANLRPEDPPDLEPHIATPNTVPSKTFYNLKSPTLSQKLQTAIHWWLSYMESQVFKIVKLTLPLWQLKLHLPILLNGMAGPQNCSYRKSTLIILILHLWQITVKFNITSLTVIKLLSSSILNLWQSLSSGLHIKAETSDAKFNITPLAFNLLLSSIIHLWQWFFLELSYRSRDDQC